MRGIITDSDGQGKITLFGKLLSKAVQFEQVAPGSDVWQGEYQGEILRAVLDPKGNLHITGSTSKADLLIEGWRDMGHDKLGIILGEFNDKAPGDGYTLIEGDWRTRIIGVEVDRGITDNRQYTYEYYWHERNANGAIINPYGVYEKDFDDVISVGLHSTIIHGRGGNDAIQGSEEKDRIYGDSGSDLLAGNGGADIIDGGDGNDFIFADAKLSITRRNTQTDQWLPPEGINTNQVIFAGRTWGVYRGQSGAIIHDGVERIDILTSRLMKRVPTCMAAAVVIIFSAATVMTLSPAIWIRRKRMWTRMPVMILFLVSAEWILSMAIMATILSLVMAILPAAYLA